MLSWHLCLFISCDSLVFWILSFDYSLRLIVWYLFFYFSNKFLFSSESIAILIGVQLVMHTM